MARFDLTDFESFVIQPLLPDKPRGVPRMDDRRVLNGIFWRLRTGVPWAGHPIPLWVAHHLCEPLQPLAQGRRVGATSASGFSCLQRRHPDCRLLLDPGGPARRPPGLERLAGPLQLEHVRDADDEHLLGSRDPAFDLGQLALERRSFFGRGAAARGHLFADRP